MSNYRYLLLRMFTHAQKPKLVSHIGDATLRRILPGQGK